MSGLNGTEGPGVEPPDRDGLELELRHLPGVEFVGLDGDGEHLVIELGTDGTVRTGELADAAVTVAAGWQDLDVEIRLVDGDAAVDGAEPGALRVQLLAAVDGRVLHGGQERVEIHLAHRGGRSVTYAGHADPVAIAVATVDGLQALGFEVPFHVETARTLPEELGAGALVVLVDDASGERRRGLANGRSLGETVARAVLNSLNRYLQSIERRPDRAGR